MKFGLFGGATARRGDESPDSQGYGKLIDLVQEAEGLGYHSIFLVEHHFTGAGQVSATLNLLTYLAAKTERIRLGTAVTVLPWHDPVLLAEQAATLDLLSRGRLDFGIGKGYRDAEFASFRIPKEEALGRFEESLELIVKSWTSDERFNHDGKYWRYSDIVVEPPVLQKPHPPLWTGAGTDESIARVAGAGLNVLFDQFASFGRTGERLRVWRAACARAGRPFDPMQVGLARAVVIADDKREYEAAVRAREERVARMVGSYGALPGVDGAQPASYAEPGRASDALIGNPDEVLRRLRRLEEMGFEYILILLPDDVETLRRFAREIMPELQGEGVPAE